MKVDGFRFAALKLCLVFGVVFVFQSFAGFEPAFNASSSPWWKFFTSIFGHGDLEHLLNNLFFIGLFGSIYERLTSAKIFYLTFIASALFANISAFLFFPGTSIIGASGGGMGLMAALAVYRPRKIGLALGVPAPMWFVLLVYIFTNVAGLSAVNSVAYEAHLIGLVAGAWIGVFLRDEDYGKFTGHEKEEEKEEKDEGDEWRKRIRKWEEKYML